MVVRADDIVAGRARSVKGKVASILLRVCIKWSLKRAKRVLVNGDELVEVIQRMYRLRKEVVGVSRNGVDTERFSPERRSEDLRAGIGSRHILVFSGVLYANRGVDVLLNAVVLLRKRTTDLKVLILGNGPELTRLLDLAATLRVKDSVHFLGTVNPDLVPDYLASSDVGIGPLRASSVTVGTYPLKVLEYMASGCVVVCVKDALSHNLIVHKRTGLIAESADPRELAKTIQAALSDKETFGRVSDNARSLAEKSYSWDTVVRKLETILRSAVEDNCS
jgi:glycosyltransferase involved in cell wall biosynthesis